jgi:hypothetical protein
VLRRRLDPRLNPTLRPHEWEQVSRRYRRWFGVVAGLLLGAFLGLAGWLFTRDLTRGMAPEAVAEAAGRALLDARQYRFSADLTGAASDHIFPTAVMKGEFQRSPQVIHLAGRVLSGESEVALEYYLEGQDLYVLHPANRNWLVLRNSPLEELTSFLPGNLAAPLLTGLRGAEPRGREQLTGGEALVLKLDLDPKAMLPRLNGLQGDNVEYRLWVYTRTLRPARFSIDVRRPGQSDAAYGVRSFSYQIAWDFSGLRTVAVPEAVKRSAAEISGDRPASGLLPPLGPQP